MLPLVEGEEEEKLKFQEMIYLAVRMWILKLLNVWKDFVDALQVGENVSYQRFDDKY